MKLFSVSVFSRWRSSNIMVFSSATMLDTNAPLLINSHTQVNHFNQVFHSISLSYQSSIILVCTLHESCGAHFTHHFATEIQIWLKFHFTIIQILMNWLLQFFSYDTTAVLSWHTCAKLCSNYSVIIWIKAKLNFHQIWTKHGNFLARWFLERLPWMSPSSPAWPRIQSHKLLCMVNTIKLWDFTSSITSYFSVSVKPLK